MTAAVLAATMVSCSSDGDAGGLDLGSTVATSGLAPTTTDPPAPTTQPVAPTDAPTTTAPPQTTAPPAVTDPPTTTTVPDTSPPGESKEDKVKADYTAALAARVSCANEPEVCDYAAIAIAGSPMDLQTRQIVQKRVAENIRGKQGQGEIAIHFEGVGFEGDDAFVSVCAYDTAVLFDIQDPLNPDDDIVVDDSKNSYRVRWQMRLQGDRWLLFEGIQTELLNDGDLCDA